MLTKWNPSRQMKLFLYVFDDIIGTRALVHNHEI